MSNGVNKTSKFSRFFKKRALALKRNYYSLPLILITICSFFFLCSLFILNKSVDRCDFKPTAVFLFLATLMSILSIVAFIGYSKKIYGEKRPVRMLIIYYVVIAICIGFTLTVFIFNEKQIAAEIAKRDATSKEFMDWYTYQTYINYGICSRVLLIIFFVLEAIANFFLIAGPVFDKKLQSIHFDLTEENVNKEK